MFIKKLSFLLLIIGAGSTLLGYETGHKLFLDGKYAESIIEFRKFLDANPRDERRILTELELSEAYFRLGKEYYSKDDFEAAIALFYSANTDIAEKELVKSYYSYAEQLRKEKKLKEAIQQLNEIITNYPKSDLYEDALLLRMEIEYRDLEDKDASITTYGFIKSSGAIQRAKPILLELCKDYLMKGDSLLNAGRFGDALRIYGDVCEWTPSYKTELTTKITNAKIGMYISQGNEALRNHNWEEATKDYNNALELAPGNREIKQKLESVRYERLRAEHSDWSKKWIDMIISKKIAVGMTEEMVKEGWGEPNDDSTYRGSGTYTYSSDPILGRTVRITFESGKVVQIR